MRIGGKMEITRDYFAPITIKIERISELKAMVAALEDAVENSESWSKERATLISMRDTFSKIEL